MRKKIGLLIQFVIWLFGIFSLFISTPPFLTKTNVEPTKAGILEADGWFKAVFYFVFALFAVLMVFIYRYDAAKYRKRWFIFALATFILSIGALIEYNSLIDEYFIEVPYKSNNYILTGTEFVPAILPTLKEQPNISTYDLIMGKGKKTSEIWTDNSMKIIKYKCLLFYSLSISLVLLFVISIVQLLKIKPGTL